MGWLNKWRKHREQNNWYGTGMSADAACQLVSSYFHYSMDDVMQMTAKDVRRLVRTCQNYRSGVNGYIRFPTLVNGKKRQLRNPLKMRSALLPSPKPGEKNPFLTDDGYYRDDTVTCQKAYKMYSEQEFKDAMCDALRLSREKLISENLMTARDTALDGIARAIDHPSLMASMSSGKIPVGTCGDIKLHDWSQIIYGKGTPQTFTEYVATCGNTQKSRWACRGCEYVGECK